MKKVTALAGVLLLSSSLVAGCTQSAAPNRTGITNYDTNRTGRVLDIGNRVGVRNITPNTTNWNNTAITNNIRNDRSLEARVESIPGIKNARVLVIGNTAYVAINQGTNLQGKAGTTSYNNTYNRDLNVNNAIGGTYRGGVGTNTGTYGTGTTYGTTGTTGTYGTTGGIAGTGNYSNAGPGNMSSYGTNTYTGNTSSVHPGSYSIRNNGVYGTTNGIAGGAGIMSGPTGSSTYALDTNRQGYANNYNAGTTVPPYDYKGNVNTYGVNNPGIYDTSTGGTRGTTIGTTPGVTGRTGVNAGTMAGGTGTTYNTSGKGTTTGTTNGTIGSRTKVSGTTGITGTTRTGVPGTNVGTYGTSTNIGTYGTGTNTGAYGTDNVAADVKARVTAAIKQGNPAIQNVYVTANPAVMDRMSAFVRDITTGHPLRGTNDLLDILRRMFPASR